MIHIGLIMDGNRRWAKERGLPVTEGHRIGAKIFLDFLKWVKNSNKVKYITAYALSSDNWKRDKDELHSLFHIFEEYLNNYSDEAKENDTKISFIGRRDRLPKSLNLLMHDIEEKTCQCSKYGLQIAVDHSSRYSIHNAISTKSALENNFSDIDLLIRSGGEHRLSDYMLYALAYAEIFFIDDLWPDFHQSRFQSILSEFELRNRRYGQ